MREWVALYHTHHSLEAEDQAFWLWLAEQSGGPVLELGCGSGRLTLPLAQRGRWVVGVDRDFDMLCYARDLAAHSGGRSPDWVQADFCHLHLAQRFALIFLACNTFSTLTCREQRAVLAVARRHLTGAGVFAVSMPNPLLLETLPPRGEPEVETVFAHPESDAVVQVLSEWRREGEVVTLRWYYDCLFPDGTTRRHELTARHRLQSLDSLRDLFEQAGLRLERQYGDYERHPFEADSPWLILTARSSTD